MLELQREYFIESMENRNEIYFVTNSVMRHFVDGLRNERKNNTILLSSMEELIKKPHEFRLLFWILFKKARVSEGRHSKSGLISKTVKWKAV